MNDHSKPAAIRRLAVAIAGLVLLLLFLGVVSRHGRVFADNDVHRIATAIRYPTGKRTVVKFRGRTGFPEMSGEAVVDRTSSSTMTTIEMSVAKMPSPLQLGPGHATYLLWKIESDGYTTVVGEIKPSPAGDFDANIKAETYGSSFALLVTAEPHFMVTRPSQAVMLENIAPGTDAVVFSVDYLARSDAYFRDPKTPQVSRAEFARTPLKIVEARQAVALAEHVGAGRHARDLVDAARSLTRESEQAWRNGKDADTIDLLATQAITNAALAEEQAQIYRQTNVNIAGSNNSNSANRAYSNSANRAYANALNLAALGANSNAIRFGEYMSGNTGSTPIRSTSTRPGDLKLHTDGSNANMAAINSNMASNATTTSAPQGDDPSVVTISRYPSVESKDVVAPGDNFSVQVSLTEEQLTPNILVKSSGAAVEKKASGEVAIKLPDSPETNEWELDVVLAVTSGDLTIDGADTATITLPRAGDSTPALFKLSAKPASGPEKRTHITAAFFNKKTNGFLLKVEREITIRPAAAPDAKTAAPAVSAERRSLARSEPARASVVRQIQEQVQDLKQKAAPVGTQFNLETNISADMTVIVDTQRRTDSGPEFHITVSSPYFRGGGSYMMPADFSKFIESEFTVFSRGRPRGAQIVRAPGMSAGTATPERLKAFGEKLYDRFVPDKFKEAFWQTRRKMGSKFKTILIITDDPEFPWELMRPRPDKNSPSIDFLGLEYAVGRLHDPDGKVLGNTQPQNAFISGIDVVPPAYQGTVALPTVKKEVDFLRSLTVFNDMDGVRQMAGNSEDLRSLLGAMPPHIIHFAGHGAEQTDVNGLTSSSVKLGDQDSTYAEWSAMMTRGGPNRPFFFLNACDVGRSGKFLTFTDGFAPAVLESGASGFIGALWSIQDDSADKFAEMFYGQMEKDLRENGYVSVADLTRRIKAEYLKDPDPTFLAYVYYGDPNLRLVSRKAAKVAAPPKTVSGGVLNSKALVLPQPVYSREARDAGEKGGVTVNVIVDEQGDVISAKAVSGPYLLRPLAESAALKAKFDGITLSGVPVRISGVLTYYFTP